eukprot:sb/3474476/
MRIQEINVLWWRWRDTVQRYITPLPHSHLLAILNTLASALSVTFSKFPGPNNHRRIAPGSWDGRWRNLPYYLACSLAAAVLLDLDKRCLIALGVEELDIRLKVKECTCRIEFPLGTQLQPAGRSSSPSNNCTCKCSC